MIVSKLIYRLSSMYDALFSVCHGKILSALSGFFSVAILYKHNLVCFPVMDVLIISSNVRYRLLVKTRNKKSESYDAYFLTYAWTSEL